MSDHVDLPESAANGERPDDPVEDAAVAALAMAGVAAYVSYWHAYAVVLAHGDTGITARLEPVTIDGLVYAGSMVVRYAAPPLLDSPGTGPGRIHGVGHFAGQVLSGCSPGSRRDDMAWQELVRQIECHLVVKGFRAPAGAGLHQSVDEIGGLDPGQLGAYRSHGAFVKRLAEHAVNIPQHQLQPVLINRRYKTHAGLRITDI